MKFTNKKKENATVQDAEELENKRKWYEEIQEDPKSFPKSTEQELIELKDEAKQCHDIEISNYNIKKSKANSNFKWMKTIMQKGTVSDKIAAHVLMIQENPVCNLDNIGNLVNTVKVSKKREFMSVIENLVEVFLSDLLRPNSKLKPFHQRPLSLINELTSGNSITRRRILCNWYFEDQLKEIYTSFILALNKIAYDTVDSNKEKAISAMYKLLAGNPEQEKNLLTYIVNKLGDPSQKVASKVMYCLKQLLFKHINMQGVVLNEIEKLIFRPNIPKRAQYYSLCFLSQYHLSQEANEIAEKLIELYLSFFKSCVKTGDIDSRMMSALLMGINRAYPYAKLDISKISEHIATMYRLVHLAQFSISLQALILLYQVTDFENGNSSRFFSALYRKLFDPDLLSTTYKAMLLSLIYKALLKDKETNRIKMFVKRLLQITLYVQPDFSCGILYLISQLMNKKSDIKSYVLQQTTVKFEDEDDDDGGEKYYDIKDEPIENPDIKEEEIEAKQEPIEVASELRNIETESIEIKEEIEDIKPDTSVLEASLKGSWYHCKNNTNKQLLKYVPYTRNPLYGGGEYCAYIELTKLKQHFHPSVSLFATNILNEETISYSGDPLNDFVLIRFLDRFVFKNPKKNSETLGKDPTFAKRKLLRPQGVKMLAVSSNSYLTEKSANIPVDELFLHSYLQWRYQERQTVNVEDSDLESVQSEEFEEMLDKMSHVKGTEDDIDFMDEIGGSMKDTTKKKKHSEQDENEEDESMSEEEFEDDEMNEDDLELLDSLDDDDDEEDIEFGDDPSKLKKKHMGKGKDISSLFASAEEFATLLEDEGSSKIKPGGSNVYSDKDNAGVKQLAWEEKRNRWIKGFDKAVGKSSAKRRPNPSKYENKKKKFKK